MSVKSLKIKNESMFYSNDMIQLNNFDSQLLKINKRENRENNDICYISYRINKPEHNINSINNLYFVVNYLYGTIEKIDGSKDRYLVIDKNIGISKNNIDSLNVYIPNIFPIKFIHLVIVINYVIEKDDKFIPEIYIDEGFFEKI